MGLGFRLFVQGFGITDRASQSVTAVVPRLVRQGSILLYTRNRREEVLNPKPLNPKPYCESLLRQKMADKELRTRSFGGAGGGG